MTTRFAFFSRFTQLIFSASIISYLLFALAQNIQASSPLKSELVSTYTINDLGSAAVEQKISLTNTNPTQYVSHYALKLNVGKLENVKVQLDEQEILANVVTQNNQTTIGITFPDSVVGEGKTRTLLISYNNPDSVVMAGSTMSISVPKLAEADTFSNYDVVLKTPLKFGQPTLTQPTQTSQNSEEEFLVTKFNNLGNRSLMAIFGDKQPYHVKITYQLPNISTNRSTQQVVLIPDTPFQRVEYQKIEPMPESIVLDGEGNWIANYQPENIASASVSLDATVFLSLQTNSQIKLPNPQKEHLESQEFWETQNEQLKQVASSVSSPEQIYQYVVNLLAYQEMTEKTSRQGAAKTQQEPEQHSAEDFVDLFVTLCRINNIPARRVVGYAYSQNLKLRPVDLIPETLHVWAEYFSKDTKQWESVDPTWANTTGGVDYFNRFDLTHIVFAFNGLSSTLPSIIESNTEEINVPQIQVNFATQKELSVTNLATSIEPKKILNMTIPGFYQLKLQNKTGSAAYDVPLKVTTPDGISFWLKQSTLPMILPFQNISIPMLVFRDRFQKPDMVEVQLEVETQKYEYQVLSGFPLTSLFRYSYYFVGLGISAISVTLITGSILVFRRTKKGPLRR